MSLLTSDDGVRLLTVRQPWASLIASGRKTIEVRTWHTSYRGPLVILAGRGRDDVADHPVPKDAPSGVLVAVVMLLDVRAWEPGDEGAACVRPDDHAGLFSWVLWSARPVSPVAMRGSLGLTRLKPARELREVFAVAENLARG